MGKDWGKCVKNDLLLVDKPVGISSFDVIRILRKEMNIRKMGHSGTLDPFASGLLIIGVGPGTKKLAQLIGSDKVYVAEILLGISTETGDPDGDIVEQVDVQNIDEREVFKELDDMVGDMILRPSIYSAVKIGGKRSYTYAREGKDVKVPPRVMTVNGYSGVSIEKNIITITWDVGSGTYVRSLGEELGRRLGYPASLKSLRRISIGECRIEDAESVDVSGFKKVR